MHDGQSGRPAFLVHGRHVGFHHRAVLALFDEGSQFGVVARGMRGQRMLGGHGAEGDAHDGVGAGGEHPQPAVVDQRATVVADVVREGKAHTGALADPVRLHGLHAFGPALKRVEIVQQFVGVLRDAEVVTGNFTLFDRRTGAPAAAVDHLFVGQHGLVDRVPVHDLGLLVGDALFQHAQEQPLVPLVVGRLAGGQFAAPVDGEAQRLQLLLHVGDVVVRPLRRRHRVLDRRVLGRQTEGVPAHGLQHVVAAHAVEAGQHVADGVVAHMAHVQLARRVGEHRQAVVLRAARVFDRPEGVRRVPVLPGDGLDGGRRVGGGLFLLHGAGLQRG